MASYQALIVDDEAPAREGIRDLLASDPDVDVCALCKNGFEALEAARAHHPALLFVDVQMPEMNGVDFVRRLEPYAPRVVIFVTAFDQYAIDAFEVAAIDYLLKPFDADRFYTALQRAKDHLRGQRLGRIDDKMERLLEAFVHEPPAPSQPDYWEHLVIKATGTTTFVQTDEIDWIEAADYYARVHTSAGTHLLRESLTTLEEHLDPNRFLRIHRSHIVNLDRVRHIKTLRNGQHRVVLKNGHVLRVSRRSYQALKDYAASL